MSVLLVTYDLNSPGQKHAKMLKKIKEYPWARLSESSYAISTSQSVDQVYETMKTLADDNDNLYVITLHRPYKGYGPKGANKWLEDNLTYC